MPRLALFFLAATFALVAVEARQGVPSVLSSPQGAATPAQPQTGILAGKVIDAGTGAPIAEVTLTLSGGGLVAAGRGSAPVIPQMQPVPPGSRRVLSDPQGRFVFRDLPVGPFSLTASAGGYISGAPGMLRPGGQGQPVLLSADGRVPDLVIKLFKYASITGTVTDEAGEPAVNVYIRPFKSDFVGGRRKLVGPAGTAITDDRGVYRIPQLVPGNYVVGFIASPISMPAEALVESERVRAVGATASAAFNNDIASSGADLFSQPGNPVGAMRLIYGTNARPPAPTDTGQVLVYPTLFHAGSPTAQGATLVAVGSGEEKTGIDFQLRPARSARVSGIVTGPDGPVTFFGLRLIAADADQFSSEMTMDPALTMTNSAGEFTFLGISPGSYVLKAVKVPDVNGPMVPFTIETSSGPITAFRPDASVPSTLPSLWGTVPVQVGGVDVGGVLLTLKPGARVSGRVEFDGTTAPPPPDRLKQLAVMIDPPGAAAGSIFSFFQNWRGQFTDTGTFKSPQLPPGRYFIRSTTPGPGWMLESITANGRDVTDIALDLSSSDITDVIVRFTDKPSQLSGVVHTAQGQPDPAASVLVFPVDSVTWTDYSAAPRRLRSVRTTTTGAFTIGSLPPGDYAVIAISDVAAATWPDPALLTKLVGAASRITIPPAQSKTQDLTTSVVR